MRLRRIVCRIWGCNPYGENLGGCDRCGADLYAADFVQLSRVRDAWWATCRLYYRLKYVFFPWWATCRLYYRLKYVFFPRKCQLCGKTMTRDKYGFWDCKTDDADHIPF